MIVFFYLNAGSLFYFTIEDERDIEKKSDGLDILFFLCFVVAVVVELFFLAAMRSIFDIQSMT